MGRHCATCTCPTEHLSAAADGNDTIIKVGDRKFRVSLGGWFPPEARTEWHRSGDTWECLADGRAVTRITPEA